MPRRNMPSCRRQESTALSESRISVEIFPSKIPQRRWPTQLDRSKLRFRTKQRTSKLNLVRVRVLKNLPPSPRRGGSLLSERRSLLLWSDVTAFLAGGVISDYLCLFAPVDILFLLASFYEENSYSSVMRRRFRRALPLLPWTMHIHPGEEHSPARVHRHELKVQVGEAPIEEHSAHSVTMAVGFPFVVIFQKDDSMRAGACASIGIQGTFALVKSVDSFVSLSSWFYLRSSQSGSSGPIRASSNHESVEMEPQYSRGKHFH